MTQEVAPATGLIQIARGGGAVELRYVGVPTVSEEAKDEISKAIDRFLDDCQAMIVWYAGIEGLQDSIHQHFSETVSRDEPFTLSNLYPNGEQRVLVQVPGDMVIDAFSRGGSFELAYTKAFVVFAYHTWEEATRPKIASALKVDVKDVKSNLMGELRHLRHWVIHTSEDNKSKMFTEAKNLVRILGLRQDEPILTPDMVFILMEYLDRMQVSVNPQSLEFGVETVSTTPEMIAKVVETMEPGTAVSMLIMAWDSHLAADIIIDDSSGTIHMSDCNQRGEENKKLGDRRFLRVPTLGFARAVVKCLGKRERLCEHCIQVTDSR